MANSRYDVEITGNNKGLTTAVNKSMEELNKLDSVANGMFSNFTGPLNNLSGGLNTIKSMTPAMRALGVAGLAAGAGLMAINKASSVVGTLNEISTNTGVSIELLQQLQKEFKSTGMEADKFGDLNKDAMDKLGDSFRNGGGGIADDLKEWGIGLETLTKYAGDAEGGIKAVIDVYYQMQQAGKSKAEITNAMESMASDASHLITTLESYSSTQEALNHIQSQNANITSEAADEYKKFDQNMKKLSSNMDDLTVKTVTPLVEEINNLWDWFDKDWENTSFVKNLKKLNEKGISPTGMSSGQVQGFSKNADISYEAQQKEWQKKYDGWAEKSRKQGADAFEKRKKQDEAQAATLKKIEEKKQEEAQKAADKARQAQEKAAREAKAAYDKMMSERKSALDTLSTLDIAIISQEARGYASQSQQIIASLSKLQDLRDKEIISQEQYNERKKALLETSARDFKESIEANPADIGIITGSLNQMFDAQQQELKIRREKGLIDQAAYNEQLENLQQEHESKIQAIKSIDANQINMQNLSAAGFATDEEMMALQQEQLRKQFEKFNEQNQTMYDNGLLNHEEFLKQKERLDQAYSVKSQNISLMETKTRVGMYNDMAQGLAGTMMGILGENNKAAQAMFAVSKGTAIAQGMLNAYEASTTAMAKYPGPMGYALAAASYAQVIGQVMSMKSITPTGMAHDGISEIPNEGTWLLDGGERVVDQRTNGDLKDFLESNKDGGNQTIDARITINGNVTDQRWFAEQLKKQERNIAAMVKDQNRRKL